MPSDVAFYEISGYCPHLDKQNTILAEYAVIYVCGTNEPGYKLLSYKCNDIRGCKEKCPLEVLAAKFKP